MEMYSDVKNDIEISDESIEKEIESLTYRLEDGFLVLNKDDENYIQCFCCDDKFGYTFILEKKDKGKHYHTLSSKISVQRFFKKWSKDEDYKIIKCWLDGEIGEVI